MTSEPEAIFFDSNVYINLFRHPEYQRRIEKFLQGAYRFVVNHVVMMELWAGANTKTEKNILQAQRDNFSLIALAPEQFIRAGQILSQAHKRKEFDSPKMRRRLTWDVLIALSAAENNAVVVTENKSDFDKIQKYVDFEFVLP